MPRIHACPLPDEALLQIYVRSGAYTDCYTVDIDRRISHEQFVAAFYTTWLFKLERWILAWTVKRPSTDAQALELAQGLREQFAAWDVEARSECQLLLCDLHGQTRSWLMTSELMTPGKDEECQRTRLYFGSAVVRRLDPTTGASSRGFLFRALLGFHRIYSRLLLRAACKRLDRHKTVP